VLRRLHLIAAVCLLAATTVPRRPPSAPPQIVAVRINSTTLQAGQRLVGYVTTSSNVASVEVRVAMFGIGLNRIGVGRFALVYTFAGVPWFLRGTYTMEIIARNARGDAVEETLPLTVR
jgi:hypothetical protein